MALYDVPDGATVLIGGFGTHGSGAARGPGR
jgi:acyl CoA:acetate/3-ketoacid CoA transferase alpha subunit